MNIPIKKKVAMLKEFHTHLYEKEWRFMESSEEDKAVLEDFPAVSERGRERERESLVDWA